MLENSIDQSKLNELIESLKNVEKKQLIGSSGSYGYDLDKLNWFFATNLELADYCDKLIEIHGISYLLNNYDSTIIANDISSAVLTSEGKLLHYHNFGAILATQALCEIKNSKIGKCLYLGQEDTCNLFHFLFFEIPHILNAKYLLGGGAEEFYVYLGHKIAPYAYDLLSIFGCYQAVLIEPKSSSITTSSVLIPCSTSTIINKSYPILSNAQKICMSGSLNASSNKKDIDVLIVQRLHSANGSLGRYIWNHDELVKNLSQYKIHVVHFENLRIKEQIVYFRRSHIVIAIHGAALSHIIFSTPGTLIIELRHILDTANHLLYPLLSVIKEISHVNISCSQYPQNNINKIDPRNIPILAPIDQIMNLCSLHLNICLKNRAYF